VSEYKNTYQRSLGRRPYREGKQQLTAAIMLLQDKRDVSLLTGVHSMDFQDTRKVDWKT
jgi:hypothetical protein